VNGAELNFPGVFTMLDEPRGIADELRRQIRSRLSQGRLVPADGVSKSHRGTGRPCVVCRGAIEPLEVERQVEGAGVFLFAHEACYKLWREESLALHRTSGR
jgi:hypothetical protein